MAIQGVLFDNDGTLVDTHDLILDSYRYALREVLGREYPENVIMAKVGQPLTVQMWDFTDDQATHDRLLEVYREHNHARHDKMISAFPDVKETLTALVDCGYRLGVVTSKRHALAQHGLEILDLMPYFSCLVGADDCPSYKPDPGPIVYGCSLVDLAPEECVYVGDSPFDIEAGKGAHATTVAALWGMFTAEELDAQHPDFTAENFAALLDLPCFNA